MNNPFDLPTAESRKSFPTPSEEELKYVRGKMDAWLKLLNPYQFTIVAQYRAGCVYLMDSRDADFFSVSLDKDYFGAWDKIVRGLKDVGYMLKIGREGGYLTWTVSLPSS